MNSAWQVLLLKRASSLILGMAFVLLCLSESAAKIRTKAEHRAIHLDWDAPSKRASGASLPLNHIIGYNIFRSTLPGGPYTQINPEPITETSYLDRNLENDRIYYYVLSTIDSKGISSAFSQEIADSPTFLPPSRLTSVAGKKMVALNWEPYKFTEIRGYLLYRSNQPGGAYQKIFTLTDISTHYDDQEVIPGKNYYYVISAVDLDWQESHFSNEAAATPLLITANELAELEQIERIDTKVEKDKIIITWQPLNQDKVAGYNLYRRSMKDMKDMETMETIETMETMETNAEPPTRLTKLNKQGLLKETSFEDKQITLGTTYYYSVAAVDKEGNEARFPYEVRVAYDDLFITSLSEDTQGKPQKSANLITVTLTGTPGAKAAFEIKGIGSVLPMDETKQPGTYYGQYQVKEGDQLKEAKLAAYLFDLEGHSVSLESNTTISLDTISPEQVQGFSAQADSKGQVILSWQPYQAAEPIDHLAIYRLTSLQKDSGPGSHELLTSLSTDVSTYTDQTTLPNQSYTYFIAAIDLAGNAAQHADSGAVLTMPDTIPPHLQSVKEISPPGPKGPGDILKVLILGEAGCTVSFALGTDMVQMAQETSIPGRYLGQYKVKEGDELTDIAMIVSITDPSGNRTTQETALKITFHTQAQQEEEPRPKIQAIHLQSLEDVLVANDTLSIQVLGTPGCTGYVSLGGYQDSDGSLYLTWEGLEASSMEGLTGFRLFSSLQPFTQAKELQPLATLPLGVQVYRLDNYQGEYLTITAQRTNGEEKIILTPRWYIPLSEIAPGVYEAKYTIQSGDYLPQGLVYATLTNQSGLAGELLASFESTSIDTSVKITIQPEKASLPADGSSQTKILITAKDAKGYPATDHEISLDLFTTADYTGIVGVGSFQRADYGQIDTPFCGRTDFLGHLEAVYTTGQAAKTVIIRATDTLTQDRGVVYLTSFIEGSLQLELLPLPKQRSRSLGEAFFITLKSERTWLTADGVSRTTIEAIVTDQSNSPVAGHQVVFSITQGTGHLTTSQKTTDQTGHIFAVYTAGTKIGTTMITAIDITAGIKNSLPIILKSDAPARVEMTAEPSSLLADGFSSTPILVKVADQHDNPNRGVQVELSLAEGWGNLEAMNLVTDFFGQATTIFQAGKRSGQVMVTARVTSAIPTKEELEAAQWAKKKNSPFSSSQLEH